MVPNQYIKQGGIIELQRHTTLTSTEVELVDIKQRRTETEFRAVLNSPEGWFALATETETESES